MIAGPSAARAYKDDLHSLGPTLAHVPVVSGGKAVRQRADKHGSVSTAEVTSINGSTYCAVIPEEGETPGEARLEKAAGDTAAIGDKAYSDIATAISPVTPEVAGSNPVAPAFENAAFRRSQ